MPSLEVEWLRGEPEHLEKLLEDYQIIKENSAQMASDIDQLRTDKNWLSRENWRLTQQIKHLKEGVKELEADQRPRELSKLLRIHPEKEDEQSAL